MAKELPAIVKDALLYDARLRNAKTPETRIKNKNRLAAVLAVMTDAAARQYAKAKAAD